MASRIAKKIISVTSGVNVNSAGNLVDVKGPKGSLSFQFPDHVEIKMEEGTIRVVEEEGFGNRAGLTRSLIANMIKGVTDGWSKTLELNGTGYRATTDGQELNLALGFSHPVKIEKQEGIAFEVKENKITIRGADKELVGRTAANIRKLKPADPYKHKGFKYEGEVLIKKAGKAAKAGGTTTK
jgi:large subunit ribosomal protein L6